MSGRSAYVRKKITETKGGAPRGRTRSTTSSERDDATISDYPMPGPSKSGGTGVATTNARFLKFPEPVMRETEAPYLPPPASSSNSQSGGSTDGSNRRGDPYPYQDPAAAQHGRPLDDFAYARARRPAIRTEDVSGIEKSGFRSAIDKKTDEVRKGLAKTFTFGKKGRKGSDKMPMHVPGLDLRPESSATVRQQEAFGPGDDYDAPYQLMGGSSQQAYDRQQQYQQAFNDPWDPNSNNVVSPPPSAKLPPVPAAAQAPPIRRWCGNGKPVQRWAKLRKDPELWDPNGDVLVYLVHRGTQPRPNASFRLSSHIIEATESRHLITLLREGSTEDSDAYGSGMPPSPVGAPPMVVSRYTRGGVPTPPISEDPNVADQDGQISYEMYFPPPASLNKMDQVRYHIATRNLFALLYHASIVGLSLHQALFDLHQRLDQYLPVASDPLGTLIHYISARGLDDVRNDPDAASALLAWSESLDVRWDEGWREAFSHCAGMHGSRLEAAPDFQHVSPVSRALLERAGLETQLRVQAAEERLGTFDFADMWQASLTTNTSPARAAADRLQMRLMQFYSNSHGSWPPPPTSMGSSIDGPASPLSVGADEEPWLTRQIAQDLQRDFGALYDYLVNRDTVFDGSETRSSRKWMMISRTTRAPAGADSPQLPLTDMLVEWDNRFRYPHLPSPLPLVPESIEPVCPPSSKSGKNKEKEKLGARANALERRVQLAYSEATNIYALSHTSEDGRSTALVEHFVKFEKIDKPLEVDPAMARLGRWVLIYGILQTLASVSVDAPAVKYHNHVDYHLSLRLKGARVPPWKGAKVGKDELLEASHELSHCWTAPLTWNESAGEADDMEDSELGYGGGSSTARMSSARSQAGVSYASSRTGNYSIPRSGRGAPNIAPSIVSSSGMSESDTASSVRTPSSFSGGRTKSRDGRQPRAYGMTAYGGPPDRVDEEWSPRGPPEDMNSYAGGVGGAMIMGPVGGGGGRRGQAGMLTVDDYPRRASNSKRGSAVPEHQTARPTNTEPTSEMGLLIRDFDELDVTDGHSP